MKRGLVSEAQKRGLVLNAATVAGISVAELIRNIDSRSLADVACTIDGLLAMRVGAMTVERSALRGLIDDTGHDAECSCSRCDERPL